MKILNNGKEQKLLIKRIKEIIKNENILNISFFKGDIEKIIEKEHSYEVPELLLLPVIKGGKKYLNWLDKVLKFE